MFVTESLSILHCDLGEGGGYSALPCFSVKSHPALHFPVTNHLGNSICLCLETEVAVAHCEQFSINFLDKISQIYTELMGTVRAGLFQEKTNVLIPLVGLSQFHSRMPLGSSSAELITFLIVHRSSEETCLVKFIIDGDCRFVP